MHVSDVLTKVTPHHIVIIHLKLKSIVFFYHLHGLFIYLFIEGIH